MEGGALYYHYIIQKKRNEVIKAIFTFYFRFGELLGWRTAPDRRTIYYTRIYIYIQRGCRSWRNLALGCILEHRETATRSQEYNNNISVFVECHPRAQTTDDRQTDLAGTRNDIIIICIYYRAVVSRGGGCCWCCHWCFSRRARAEHRKTIASINNH